MRVAWWQLFWNEHNSESGNTGFLTHQEFSLGLTEASVDLF